MSFLAAPLREACRGWNRFWFDSRSDSALLTLGVFRAAFAAVMLFAYFSRAFDLAFFYGPSGIMPAAYRQASEAYRFHPTFLDAFPQAWALEAWHAAFLLSLVFLALGLFTRYAAAVSYFLHLMFLNRNMGIFFGVDTISTFFLFYLCFADSGRRFSLDASWRGRRGGHGVVSHVAWRLMQIQVCVIYAYSGMEKLRGGRWWDGSALWDVLSAGHLQRFDLSVVAQAPIVLAAAVYLLLLWELYFAVLVWVPKLRLPTLAFGVVLHLGIFFFMNLPSFGFMMITLYLLFLKQGELEDFLQWPQSWGGRPIGPNHLG